MIRQLYDDAEMTVVEKGRDFYSCKVFQSKLKGRSLVWRDGPWVQVILGE